MTLMLLKTLMSMLFDCLVQITKGEFESGKVVVVVTTIIVGRFDLLLSPLHLVTLLVRLVVW